MNIDSINYQKSIENNSLIYNNRKGDKFLSLLPVIFGTTGQLFLLITLFPKILNDKPTKLDYFMAFLLPTLTIILGLYWTKNVLKRNQLKKINYSIDFEQAKSLIVETATNINWKLTEKDENIMIFKTDRDPLMEKQVITIIITPNRNILFNSSPSKNSDDYFAPQNIFSYRRARFYDNYINFQANFQKTAANNGYHK